MIDTQTKSAFSGLHRFFRAVPGRILFFVVSAAVLSFYALNLRAEDSAGTNVNHKSGLVPLILKLPDPAFKGTPKDMPVDPSVEPLSDKPRPPLMVPPGLVNIVAGKVPTCSDPNASPRVLAKITDGRKGASDDNIVLLRKHTQYIQFDLGGPHQLFAIVVWHAFDTPKIYRDVIVQVADDADFHKNVRTLFNNDRDNSSGLGVGKDREYFETHEGKLIDAKGVTASFVRLYSRGSTESALNEYTEVEIYGRPAK